MQIEHRICLDFEFRKLIVNRALQSWAASVPRSRLLLLAAVPADDGLDPPWPRFKTAASCDCEHAKRKVRLLIYFGVSVGTVGFSAVPAP